MKNKMLFIICIVILNSINSWSFDSGWENLGNFKKEKLSIPKLSSLQVSPDFKYFYTFNNDNTIRIWDMLSAL